MSPAPSLPADLHYADRQPVRLDVAAIIAHGTRIRRRRLLAMAVAVAAVCAVTPAVIVTDVGVPVPVATSGQKATTRIGLGPEEGGQAAPAAYAPEDGVVNGPDAREFRAPFANGLVIDVATATRRLTARVPRSFGRILAIAGARSGTGVWFAAASTRLTLFHLSASGKISCWPLAGPSGAQARKGVGLAVTTGGVAWLGVASTLIRIDTETSSVSSWPVPDPRSNRLADPRARPDSQPGRAVYSIAAGPDGRVAVAMSRSSSVQVLNPRSWTFSSVWLPAETDQPLAVGFSRDGTLGIGYRDLGRPRSRAVMLVERSGARLTAPVAQSSPVTSYGWSGLLVGTGEPDVVSAAGTSRPLVLPVGAQSVVRDVTPPVPLPGDRLGIALDTGILTFPASAASAVNATSQSELWLPPQQRCARRHGCPAGYRQLAADAGGDVWLVPSADQRVIELLSLR